MAAGQMSGSTHIHWVQHVPFEGLGTIGEWAEERGHLLTSTFALTEDFPSPERLDWLVVMGGPMGVADERLHPWLAAEKRFIRSVIDSGARVLGVCLGAQLIAEALGGLVHTNKEWEIGWYPVTLTAAGRASRVFHVLPANFLAGHWHGDTFDLPARMPPAARSEACPSQAFEFGDRVWGLQFHLEWDRDALRSLIERCGGDIVSGRHVQSAEEMLGESARFAESRRLMRLLLDAMEKAPPRRT